MYKEFNISQNMSVVAASGREQRAKYSPPTEAAPTVHYKSFRRRRSSL